ncbi:MAG: HAMP domain-containing sensor histidine kinase [Sulfurimonas sp.]
MNLKELLEKIYSHSTFTVVTAGTVFILISSVVLVYLISKAAAVEYTLFLLTLSIVLPLLLAPIALYSMVKQSHKLQHTQKHLDCEIKKRQEQEVLLFEKARYILMGEMMANISHQWKQPLNTVSLAIVNLKLNKDPAEDEKLFEIMEQNINYLAATVDDFLSFFDQKSHQDKKNLEAIKHEVESIIGIGFDAKKIELVIDLPQQNVAVASSLIQVILNLLNNAKDALEDQEVKKVKLSAKVQDEMLVIECCDNGTGIKDEIQDKIFIPYFTTKSKSKGTGIGLYMSREIVEKVFGGELQLLASQENANGYKTCFQIKIPPSELCKIDKDR